MQVSDKSNLETINDTTCTAANVNAQTQEEDINWSNFNTLVKTATTLLDS